MAGEDSEQAGNRRVSRWEQAGVSSTRDPSGSWMKFSSESHSSGVRDIKVEIPATPLEPPDRSTSALSAFIRVHPRSSAASCAFLPAQRETQTPILAADERRGTRIKTSKTGVFLKRTKCTKPRRLDSQRPIWGFCFRVG